MKIALFQYHKATFLSKIGLTGAFWTLHADTILYTWAAMLILFIVALIGHRYLKRNEPSKISILYEKLIILFMNLCKESFGIFHYRYFAFIMTIFLFTLFCCLTGLIPFLDESTNDLNTTLALGLTSFIYIQIQKIKCHGFLKYLKEFADPIPLLLPLNIIGELAKIASMSFRLFGNILGGGIIFSMIINFIDSQKTAQRIFIILGLGSLLIIFLSKKLPNLLAFKNRYIRMIFSFSIFAAFLVTQLQLFFGIFEGAIQSFVLTMLTITYLSMGASPSESDSIPEEVL